MLLMLLVMVVMLLLMACAPSRHRLRLAGATDLPGTVESVDRGSVSVVPKIFPLVLVWSAVGPVFQHLWCLATSWAVGVNCVVHQILLVVVMVLLLSSLLLLLMMACAPSRHRLRLTSATDLPAEQLTV